MKALAEFHQELVAIYGYGLQVSSALKHWNQWLTKLVSSTSTTPDNLMFFGSDNPNDPDAAYVYQRSVGYLIDASEADGKTFIIHRRSLIVLLYASWEDGYRQEIALEAGLKSGNDLKSDVFGDIRTYRHAIVHAKGKLQDEPKIFRFFSKGQELDLSKDHLDEIFRAAAKECNQLGQRFFGNDPGFTFEEPLNAP